jgi:preprotein translocase subunit YajC
VALIVALLLIGATAYTLIDTRRQSRERAIQQANASIERGQRLLAESGGDGKLTEGEIVRALRASQASQENTARGRDTVAIVAQVRGTQAGLFGGTEVLRCYAYTVTFEPQRPHVQAREIDSCA